jgi:hypothetical protein
MPKSIDIPACPEVPNVRSSGRETREYQIRLITPLFGGVASAVRETTEQVSLGHLSRADVRNRLW